MQLGHLTVVAIEESDKVLSEVALILFIQRADNTAVDADVFRIFRVLIADENVARMHVCMEEAVAENLSKEDLHATLGQQLHVGALFFQRRHVRDRNTVDTFHHHHVLTAIVRIDFRNIQHRAVFKVSTQLNGVRRFTQQVKLVNQRFFVFPNHFQRTQTATIRQQTRHPASQAINQLHVCFDNRQDIRTNHFDDHLFAIFLQARGVNLRNRGRGQGLNIEIIKPGLDGDIAHRFFDLFLRSLSVKRSNAVLQ